LQIANKKSRFEYIKTTINWYSTTDFVTNKNIAKGNIKDITGSCSIVQIKPRFIAYHY